jgi:hypothetical protein
VNYLTRPRENRLFRQCRRAWDLAAGERQHYEPVEPAQVFDFGEAMHDALDVYYFPGMWEWNRAIVRPLAVAGFEKSMRRQRAAYAQTRDLSADQVHDFDQHLELGARVLERYFEWALEMDRFTPIQVAAQFDINVPDPANPDSGLLTPDRRPIQFRVKIDLAVIDDHELYWLVEHRIIADPTWPDIDQLRLDEQALTRSWAWQLHFLAKLEGTIHNELRAAIPDPAQTSEVAIGAVPGPGGIITQRSTESFRRIHLPRTELEIERRGVAVARDLPDPVLGALFGLCLSVTLRGDQSGTRRAADPAGVLPAARRRGFRARAPGLGMGFCPRSPPGRRAPAARSTALTGWLQCACEW